MDQFSKTWTQFPQWKFGNVQGVIICSLVEYIAVDHEETLSKTTNKQIYDSFQNAFQNILPKTFKNIIFYQESICNRHFCSKLTIFLALRHGQQFSQHNACFLFGLIELLDLMIDSTFRLKSTFFSQKSTFLLTSFLRVFCQKFVIFSLQYKISIKSVFFLLKIMVFSDFVSSFFRVIIAFILAYLSVEYMSTFFQSQKKLNLSQVTTRVPKSTFQDQLGMRLLTTTGICLLLR